jgi:cobalt/nickel transport system permease protein
VGGSLAIAIFFAATLGDLATYLVTAGQMAMAFPDPASGYGGALTKFISIFAVTQVPLAVIEGLLTVIIINLLSQYSRAELIGLRFLPGEAK